MKLVKIHPSQVENQLFAKEITKSDLLSGLNTVQREAAEATEGPLLIIAGAGSGKTRVLTYRIAHLIERGIAPFNILALTFTNKAAGEMKQRIGSVVGENRSLLVWAGTFHSIFSRILRREAESIGYTSSFSIYDTDDSLSAVRAIMKAAGISQQQFTPQQVFGKISSAKNQMLSWQEFQRVADNLIEKQAGLVFQEYEKRLRSSNSMDFDDLLLNTIRLFQNNPNVLDRYHEHFKYILVDEYQDTNKAQYTAVRLLAEKYRNLCVVGDDAQSIYGWRGADIRNILDFQRDYSEARIVRLEQNYRSTKTIISAAEDVINNNRNQLKKKLWTENEQGEKITLLPSRDDREEADKIAEAIKNERRTNNRELREFAILYRTNAQSQAIEDSLRRSNLSYSIVGGVSFYKRKEVKDALAYLKLTTNPSDAESLLRVINEPTRGLGSVAIGHVQKYAAEMLISLFEAFRQAELVPDLQPRAINSAQNFTALISRFIALKDTMRPDEFAKMYLEATGLMRMYQEDGSEEALDKWRNIERVLSHLAEFSTNDPEATLDRYLQEIALVTELDLVDGGKNGITLMTLHAAKGLEFPVVFLAGMEKGLFPLAKAEQFSEEMEEERRLFYVGVTRAEKKLYLSYAEKRFRYGELTYSSPSRFLGEIRPELLEKSGSTTGSTAKTTSVESPKSNYGGYESKKNLTYYEQKQQKPVAPQIVRPKPPKSYYNDIPAEENYSQVPTESGGDGKLRLGSWVHHEIFGDGKIMSLTGQGDNKQAVVHFKSVGKKSLMLKFAKLTLLK